MEKLKLFTFNNLRWKCRKFTLAEIAETGHGFPTPLWWEPFSATLFDSESKCKNNLLGMIGLGYAEWVEFRQTNDHWVDAEGVAWPVDTIVVAADLIRPNSDPQMPCYLVAPAR